MRKSIFSRALIFFHLSLAILFLLLASSCDLEENHEARYFASQNAAAEEDKKVEDVEEPTQELAEEIVEDIAEETAEEDEEAEIAKWTFIVYMAADNELESAAVLDVKEMERADLSSDINVLILLDRAEGNDSSNGDWTGTRLYELLKSTSGTDSLISSRRLDCPELELFTDRETELDMGSKDTLSAVLKFARREFESENLGLIIWGHGSGWRGFVEDEANSSSLSLPSLRLGIENGMDGKKLDFLGFDTCFSTTLEVAFELKDCAEILAGTPGIVGESGWNYSILFSQFLEGELTAENFAKECLSQFSKTYADYQYGAFAALNLCEIENLAVLFDDFAEKAASKVSGNALRTQIFSLVEKKSVSYMAESSPTDFYVDVLSLSRNICSVLNDEQVALAGEKFEAALNSSLLCSWNVLGGSSLSVYFGYYKTGGVFSLSHPENYINGSRNSSLCKFVSLFNGYVPTKSRDKSLLDKLFYADF